MNAKKIWREDGVRYERDIIDEDFYSTPPSQSKLAQREQILGIRDMLNALHFAHPKGYGRLGSPESPDTPRT